MGIEYKQSKNEFISDRVLKDCGWGTKIGIHELKEKMKNNRTIFMEAGI
jgi:hypothetical protein